LSAANTIVINAAGTGTRLGLNVPKSMVELNGKSIIERQLAQLQDVENIVVVVGFRGRELTDLIWQLRRDVLIVINHNYQSSGTAKSLVMGSKLASSRVVSLDGDLLVDTNDLKKFVNSSGDLIGVIDKKSKLPVLVDLEDSSVKGMDFDLNSNIEWTGLLSIERTRALKLGNNHVFEGLRQFLPIKAVTINCFEIDEPEDIPEAENWLKNLEAIRG
jgi:choline kinase